MLGLLRRRIVGTGRNGDASAFMTHVRNGTGRAGQERTLDAVSMSLWPSRGLELSGYEVKCSRADWLTELRNPEKSEVFVKFMDRFYLVAADADICQGDELPPTWGLLVAEGSRLVCKRDAPKLDPEPMDRLTLAGLLRSAAHVGGATPEEIEEAKRSTEEHVTQRLEARHRSDRERLEKCRKMVNDFEEASGVKITAWKYSHEPAKVGEAVRSFLAGDADVEKRMRTLAGIRRTALSLSEQVEATLAAHDLDPDELDRLRLR